MIPVVTPEEMKAIDQAASEPTEVLVHRAGGAVARVALAMMGGAYGRRVAVVAGKGNNGADGRDAADRLRRRRARVDVVDAADAPSRLEGDDVAAWLPERPREAHKWMSAVYVVAGSPGMMGAAHLTSQAALRAGAGMVRLGSPGADPHSFEIGEVVGRPLPLPGWQDHVPEDAERARALIIGPGLGREERTGEAVREVLARTPLPA